ncbi:MAG: SMC-Scp complex subunit ScpB [Planctomycetota bacterium]
MYGTMQRNQWWGRTHARPWGSQLPAVRRGLWPPEDPQNAAETDPDTAAAPEDRDAKLARLEAVLFLSREPVSTRKLASLARLADGTEARTLARELARRLEATALEVVEVAGGLQLMTRPELAAWLEGWCDGTQRVRLSGPALETLTVVAYRQPIGRAEIEAIRGVRCGEILRVLMEKGLLRIVGRAEGLGRPMLYGTTRFFLQVFGLGRLEHLPAADQIRAGVYVPSNGGDAYVAATKKTAPESVGRSESGGRPVVGDKPAGRAAKAAAAARRVEGSERGDQPDEHLDRGDRRRP